MSRIAYVNGRYIPHDQAAVHIEDRGFQFADGVYEVCAVLDGIILDLASHLERLSHSLSELNITPPVGQRALCVILTQMIKRNRLENGLVYVQITRGVAPRDHVFPGKTTQPSLIMTARNVDYGAYDDMAVRGVSVIGVPDTRWGRCDIKSVSLLPNILAKQAAREAGAFEAWMVDDTGLVTEGSSTNAWIIDDQDRLITRPLGPDILSGVTRRFLIEVVAMRCGLTVIEQPFTIQQAQNAQEAFITAATIMVLPVVKIDGVSLGKGNAGPISLKLRDAYRNAVRHVAAHQPRV